MFRKMPLILLAVIVFATFANSFLPISFKSILFAISLSIKSIIIFILPFLIFGLLFKTAVNISRKATKMIIIILLAVTCSSLISLLFSYTVSSYAFGLDLPMIAPQDGSSLVATWVLVLPKYIGNDHAMLAGLLLGILLTRFKLVWAEKIALWFDNIISKILKVILCMIPVFIAGFVLKLSHEKVMGYILENYALIFGIIACAAFSYITLFYLVINRLQWRPFIQSIKNMLPAAVGGFGSMSSAACMPLTILGAEKNAKNPQLARAIIPATVNIHLIGDCFATPIFAFAILNSFGMLEPSFLNYLFFAFYFILAKFSVAAVPGGGIIVMLPILESCFGFNAEMLSLITALYMLFDPVITCANVLGNGGFALGMDKVFRKSSQI